MGLKESREKMKVIFALLALAVLAAGCAVGPAPSEPMFAEKIGSYTLEDKEITPTDCDIFEKGTKDVEGNVLGIEGQVCTRLTRLEYADNSTGRVVFVWLSRYMEGKDVMKKLLGEAYPRIYPGLVRRIEGTNVYRMENAEIFWFSDSGDFDHVLIQEGEMYRMPNGGASYRYPYLASINNSVAQHFLAKYSASEW